MRAEPSLVETDREYATALGLRVRVARLSLGWSCERLAEMANISGRAVQLIEQGKGNPTLSTLNQLANALQQDLRDLLPQ
jgi:transcriptional regulator with XRE-family HTH domain